MERIARFSIASLAVLAYVWLAWAAENPSRAVIRLECAPAAGTAAQSPLVYWSESWDAPRPVHFSFLRLDLSHPAYEVFTIVGADPDGEGPAEARLESPLSLASRFGAIAAVNANAFRHLPGASEVERARGWFEGKLVDIAGLTVADGTLRSTPDGTLSSLWTDAKGTVGLGQPADLAQVRQGVSAWIDRLLTDGQIVARADTQLHPRTLAGVDQVGRVLLLAVVDGRQKGYSEGLSLPEAAEAMRQHGCFNAVNLDGGGSSIMLVRDETAGAEAGLTIVNRPSGGSPRPIPVMLGVRLRAKPLLSR